MDEGLEAGDRGKKEGLAKQLCGSVMLDKRDSRSMPSWNSY